MYTTGIKICLAFINFFLVNPLVCHLPYLVHDLYSGCCLSLLDLSGLLFHCLVYLFLFSGILWFLATAIACLGAFRYWAVVPKEFPLSFRRSKRSSSSLIALRTPSSHSLLSMYSYCIDIGQIASSGASSSTIFLKAITVTLAQLFLISICCRNSSMSPLYLIW